jgi:AcrR family transcriptional regulator
MPKVIDGDTLFEVTVRTFAELGYTAATMKEIALRAGVNEVTLFRRYGNKATLIRVALVHCLSSSPFSQVVASDDVRADLAAIVDSFNRTSRAYGGAVVTLLTEIPRHPELRGAIAALVPNLQRAAQIITDHQDRGRLTRFEPLQGVALLLAPLLAQGLWTRAGTDLLVFDLDPVAVVDHFLNGHRPR